MDVAILARLSRWIGYFGNERITLKTAIAYGGKTKLPIVRQRLGSLFDFILDHVLGVARTGVVAPAELV